MTHKVCRFYHQRKHRALGIAPALAWERGFMDEAGKFSCPPLIARPVDFRMDFLPYEIRLVRRTGIELNASRYWHEDLVPMLNTHIGVMVRYDPRDPSTVWVRRPDGVLVTVPVIGGRAACSLSCRSTMDPARQAQMDAAMDAGFDATDRIEANAQRATRQARRARGTKRLPPLASVSDSAALPQIPPSAPPSRSAIQLEEWN